MEKIYYWIGAYFTWAFIVLFVFGVIVSLREWILTKFHKSESAELVNTKPAIDSDYEIIQSGDKTFYYKKNEIFNKPTKSINCDQCKSTYLGQFRCLGNCEYSKYFYAKDS